MPEIMRVGKFRFVIYYHDHWPLHVHVYGPNSEAKFEIYTGRCLGVLGMNSKTVAALSLFVIENQQLLIQAWEQYEKEKK